MSAKLKPIGVSAERKSLLGRIHVLKKQLGLGDDDYRAKLKTHTGKESAAELSDIALRDVLSAWTKDLPAGERRVYTSRPRWSPVDEPQQRFVRALWIALYNLGGVEDGSDKALDAFVARQVKVDALRFLRPGPAAEGVVEALKAMLAREGWTMPPRTQDRGRMGRVMLVRAQWAKLHRLGAARLPGDGAIEGWMVGRIVPGRRSLGQLTDEQLDAASKALGVWLRETTSRDRAR